jgi:hypothetical protein
MDSAEQETQKKMKEALDMLLSAIEEDIEEILDEPTDGRTETE